VPGAHRQECRPSNEIDCIDHNHGSCQGGWPVRGNCLSRLKWPSRGNVCGSFSNVITACSGGACQYSCAAGFADCDGAAANGCEVDLYTDPNNCGACGSVCPAGAPHCVNGACAVCPSGAVACPAGCAYLGSDPYNCGACGNVCPAAAPHCVAGTCTSSTQGVGFCVVNSAKTETGYCDHGPGSTCGGYRPSSCVVGRQGSTRSVLRSCGPGLNHLVFVDEYTCN